MRFTTWILLLCFIMPWSADRGDAAPYGDACGNSSKDEGSRARNRFGVDVFAKKKRSVVATRARPDESPEFRVYDWDGVEWKQIGEDVLVKRSGDEIRVGISDDIIVVGAYEVGLVRTYRAYGDRYKALPGSLDEPGTDDFGASLDLEQRSGFPLRMVVGAPSGSGPGAAFVYELVGDEWMSHGTALVPGTVPCGSCDPSGDAGLFFGQSVAMDGDRILVGSPGSGSGGLGAVYVYEFDGKDWVIQCCLAPPNNASDYFGASVALCGDIALVGAPGVLDPDGSSTSTGDAHLYKRSDAGDWVLLRTFVPSDGRAKDGFGTSVDVSETLAVVGAPYHDLVDECDADFDDDRTELSESAGAGYVYALRPGGWAGSGKLTATGRFGGFSDECPDPEGYFGIALMLHENSVVVGAPDFTSDGDSSEAGKFFTFACQGASLTADSPIVRPGSPIQLTWSGPCVEPPMIVLVAVNGAPVFRPLGISCDYRATLPWAAELAGVETLSFRAYGGDLGVTPRSETVDVRVPPSR